MNDIKGEFQGTSSKSEIDSEQIADSLISGRLNSTMLDMQDEMIPEMMMNQM